MAAAGSGCLSHSSPSLAAVDHLPTRASAASAVQVDLDRAALVAAPERLAAAVEMAAAEWFVCCAGEIMTRCLHVQNGFVVNIVEYPNGIPATSGGADVIPAVTGLESVGDAFDVTSAKRATQLSAMDTIVIQELFRLTNETRILQLKGPITLPQYLTALKTLM